MADKNITLRQKNTSGAYDKLYTKTTATQSKLSTATAALFGNNITDADAALSKVADAVKTIGDVRVKVVDPNGNPIQGARITGLYGTPTTASDGTAHGVLQTNPISISSPYIDLKDQTADASSYAGSFDVLTITLPIVGENNVKRITSSQTVKFRFAKTVDVCCVGGGGGGANYILYSSGANSFVTATNPGGGGGGANYCMYESGVNTIRSYTNPGGGGGGIVNSIGVTVQPNTSYQVLVGQGGTTKGAGSTNGSGNTGGTSSFAGVSAAGGGGGIAERIYVSGQYTRKMEAGVAGVAGCGDGGSAQGNGGDAKPGSANTTISEFNDGSTFYSGGGGAGSIDFNSVKAGGAPNGASGAYWYDRAINASSAGIGGGGGGGIRKYNNGSDYTGYASAGGPGLVAIRFHF